MLVTLTKSNLWSNAKVLVTLYFVLIFVSNDVIHHASLMTCSSCPSE